MEQQDNQAQRRKYPIDKAGGKSEWYGMEQHLSEIATDLQKYEKDIINLKKKELLTELDKKMLEQLQVKQEELQLKQMETQQMLQRKQIFDEEQRKWEQDKKTFKNAIYNQYDRQKQEQIMRDLDQRQQQLAWENQFLEENRNRMQSEQRKRQLQREIWAQEQQQDVQLANQKQQEFQRRQQIEQQEIVELNRKNAEREIIKEENYRNFYRLCADNQANLQKLHMDNVMQPLVERQRQLEDMIARNVDVYQKKQLQDELDRVLKRQQERQATLFQNKQIMAEHQQIKDYERYEKEERNKQRLDDIQNYNSYLSYKKQEQVDRQKQYKEFLDQQKREKEEQKLKEQRMGRQEKAMNMLALQSYKNAQITQHALIPGFSPQIGQLPPKQNIYVGKSNQLNQVQQLQQETINNNMSQINYTQDSRYARNTLRDVGQSSVNPLPHNPLTNPIPFVNQNPYIRKEQEQAIQNRSFNNRIY